MSYPKWLSIVVDLLAICILLTFLYIVRAIIPPFAIAFVIAWLLTPMADYLQKRGVRRMFAILGVYAAFLAVVVISISSLAPHVKVQAINFWDDLPQYTAQFKGYVNATLHHHQALLIKFKQPTTFDEIIRKNGLDASKWANQVETLGQWIISKLSKALWLVIIPLAAFYFLIDMWKIRAKAQYLLPEAWRPRGLEVTSRMSAVFRNYVRGLVVICVMYGIATTLLLIPFHLKYGVIIGLLAGLLYSVPYIGAISTILLISLVGIATYPGGVHQAMWPALAMLLLNQTFDYLIAPKVLGKSVGLHPVLSLFAMMAGGHLFGIAGMILAVPVAASILEIVFEFYPHFRPDPKEKTPGKPFVFPFKKRAKA